MNHDKPSKDQVRALAGRHVADQYARKLSVVDVSAGLDQLHGQLVDAAQDYEAGPQFQRQAICDAIIATSEFLRGQGFGNAATIPLSRVLWAIVDLCEQNHPDPLFCEKPRQSKPKRNMEDAVRQGQLAALADALLASSTSDEGDEAAKLERAARLLSGKHFGALDGKNLSSARSYQRQMGQHELVYQSYKQMTDALATEANTVGGDSVGLRTAIQVQIDALNAKAELLKS